MGNSNADGGPIEAAADVVGPQATEAFALVGNETRLAILLALWEAFEPFADGEWDPSTVVAVAFTDLRDRVGMRDPGQFNYHLDKLKGEFVEQTDDGYQLLPAGNKLVRSIIASAGFEEPGLEPAELDIDCRHCGAPTEVTYQNQRVYHLCTECDGALDFGPKHPDRVIKYLMANPTILHERSPEAVYEATLTNLGYDFRKQSGGVCPVCSGRIDASLNICPDHAPGDDEACPTCGGRSVADAQFVCTVCKYNSQWPAIAYSFYHPSVGAFAWKHGIELGYGSWDLETDRWVQTVKGESEQEPVSFEPPQVRVTLRHEGDEVQLTFDEEMDVVEVNEDF